MFGFRPFSTRALSSLRLTRLTFLGEASFDISLVFQIYVATKEFATEPDDTLLPNQPFFGTLTQPLSVSRSIVSNDIIGRFSQVSGEINIANVDEFYDFLIQGYAIDGREIIVKVGEEGTDSSTWQTIFRGPGSDWSIAEDMVSIRVQDNSYKLGVPAQPNTYAGTGGIEGADDLKGKPKPLALGYVENATPPLVQANILLYQVHDGQVQAIAVFDQAVALTLDADYATSALLIAASVTPGKYATCLAEGFFRLNALVNNSQITADIEGDKTGGSFVSTAADIVRRLIERTETLSVPDDLYLPNFTRVNTQQPAQLGYWIPPDQNPTVSDVCADIMASVGGWAGFRRTGKFEAQIFTGPADTPSLSVTLIEERDIKRNPSPVTPPVPKWRVGWGRNWTVQAQVAGAASDARRTFVSDEYRYATAESTQVRTDHPFTKDRDPIRSYFRNEADALTEAARLLALYRGTRALYSVDLGTEPLSIEIGDTMNVTYRRWDLKVGRNLSLVGVRENAANNACTADVWG